MYDLIVIGGGPAGLTAAIYGLRKHLEVLLISQDLGGKTNYSLQLPEIKHHLIINGEDVVNRFASELEYLDFVRVTGKVDKIEVLTHGFEVTTRGKKTSDNSPQKDQGKSIIIATGAEPTLMNIPGELEYIMRGVCFSATTYACQFFERRAIVVGDTELALMATMELSLIASHVTLVAPTLGELHSPLGQHLRHASNVSILEGYQPQAVKGDLYARSLLVAKDGKLQELETDGIFVELGLKPNSQIVADLVELESDGRIIVDFHNRTSLPGIFAAGDVTNVYAEQVLIAVGEGAKAALAAHKYLLSQPSLKPDV